MAATAQEVAMYPSIFTDELRLDVAEALPIIRS